MNEQAEQKQVKSNSNAFNLEEGIQDMIVRIMTIAHLLVVDDATPRNYSQSRMQKTRERKPVVQ
jgi:hypothetical protein